MFISASEVQIDVASMRYLNPATNVYTGLYHGQPARFIEKRQLDAHLRAGIDSRARQIDEAILRLQYTSSRHVPVVGVYHAGDELGNRTFLVEAPYQYISLEEHLAFNPSIGRKPLLQEASEVVAESHANGTILGSVLVEDFVVDSAGKLYLSSFEHMCVASLTMPPFRPLPSPSVHALGYMAPELLESLRSDGPASLTRATDIYSLGCFAYQLFTGTSPFSQSRDNRMRYNAHMAQAILIQRVVDHDERPARPAAGSHAYTGFGLTDGVWSVIEECWRSDPGSRPSALNFHSRIV